MAEKNIQEIYQDYQIMPQLQEHQFRVAAVGKVIAESMEVEVDAQNIIEADLLHDMGNIIKFNLKLFPQFLEPEGLEYWQGVRQSFIDKYGSDEHDATHAIAKELGVNMRTMELIEAIGFSNAPTNAASDDFSRKIAAYSDFRVIPTGITSMQARFDEGLKRYQKNKKVKIDKSLQEKRINSAFEMEKQIFAKSKINPEDITDTIINQEIASLKNYQLTIS